MKKDVFISEVRINLTRKLQRMKKLEIEKWILPEEDVKAKLDNGVLTLCIKKVDEKEEPKAKYIAIE